jgi:hypothetical protein
MKFRSAPQSKLKSGLVLRMLQKAGSGVKGKFGHLGHRRSSTLTEAW